MASVSVPIPGRTLTWESLSKITVPFDTLPDSFVLKTDILLPPSLPLGHHPLIIAYHGRGLVGGARDHYEYMGAWVPDYAASTAAIIISPDYRLLPKASGSDIVADLESLWKWVHSSLVAVVEKHFPGHSVDLNKILLQGGSAGGYAALQLALSHPDEARAAIAFYPLVNNFLPHMVNQRVFDEALFMGKKETDAQVKAAMDADWVVDRSAPEYQKFCVSYLLDFDTYLTTFGNAQNTSHFQRLAKNGDAMGLPKRVWIAHGKEDSIVSVESTMDFVDEVKAKKWNSDIKLTIVENEPSEHGFDRSWTLRDEKLSAALDWISKVWLK